MIYYVNDRSPAGDAFTTARGDNRNTGKLASVPKPLPNTILRVYDLGPTNRVCVDTGAYALFDTVVLSGTLGIGDDEGFLFTGPTDPARVAWFRHATPLTVAPLIELNDADLMTLAHLTLSNSQVGLYLRNDSTEFDGRYLTLTGNTQDGLRADTGSAVRSLRNLTASNNGGAGISVTGNVGEILDTVVADNGGAGISITGTVDLIRSATVSRNSGTGVLLSNPGAARLESSVISGNRTGVEVSNAAAGAATVVGNADLALGRGNVVTNNTRGGISASGNVLVAGNTVFGHTNTTAFRITSAGATVSDNVVHTNYEGIVGSGTVERNRVYRSTATGIRTVGATVRGNVVYSNATGIQTTATGGALANNLVYANSVQGVTIQGGAAGLEVVNNTVYQGTGNAVAVESGATNVRLRNNILWAEAGYDLTVERQSQNGFQSDYNLFHTTGTGKVGLWQGVAQATLANWRTAAFTDANSLAGEPLFVDRDGADNLLGFGGTSSDGRDDDFHLQSRFGSTHGGSFAPVLSATIGLPVAQPNAATADAAQSPAIDRGAPTDNPASEPAPNGAFINLGAFGGTAQASVSPAQYVVVTNPGGGEAWPARQTFEIRWRSHDNAGAVTIELLRAGSPTPVLTIAAGTPNDGSYSWTVPESLAPAADYLIRVTRGALTDVSDAPFSVLGPVSAYYVNDGSVAVGDWTTAVGNDANDGLSPATPKASLRALLEAYDLGPGDTVYVDAGVYTLTANVLLTENDSGVTIVGYRNAAFPERKAVLNRGNVSSGSYVLELGGADDVTVSGLSLTGGEYGAYGGSAGDSDRVTLRGLDVYGNYSGGVYVLASSDDFKLLDSAVHDHVRGAGVSVQGARAVVSGNAVYGNQTGVQASGPSLADRVSVSGNVVYGNLGDGIAGGGWALVSGNVAYGQSAGSGVVVSGSGAVASGNEAFANQTGVSVNNGALASGNRAYANTGAGILLATNAGGGSAVGNVVYSNATGISASGGNFGYSYNGGEVSNNLVYANTGTGLLLSGAGYVYTWRVTNNTVYQPVGDAVRVEGRTAGIDVRNNVLWTEAGYALSVAADSVTGFSSDYNLFHQGADPNAHLGRWNNVVRDTLADWRAASGQDAHAVEGDPGFVDLNGADNVLGYRATAGGYDGGADDNFYRVKRSIAIDAGDTWAAPATDIEGFTRRDDPGTANTGSPDYEEVALGSAPFAAVGTARNWRSDNTYFSLSLPFGFSFYGTTYTTVYVSTEGFLAFTTSPVSPSDSANTADKLRSAPLIAPLWDNLRTNGTGDDIFVDTTTAGRVTIRWNATNAGDNTDVNFSVTLFSDGTVRFDYGSGNTNLTPTVGISRGDGRFSVLSANDGRTSLTNVAPVEFRLTQGHSIADIGAFEFRGSSLDETPPTVVAVTPAFIAGAGAADAPFDTITVTFSEDVNPIDARAAANYELRHPGADGVFDNADDLVFGLTAGYDPNTFVTTLAVAIPNGRLPAGNYRFTVFDGAERSIHDLAGLRLDADGNPATASGRYTRYFTIGNLPPALDPVADRVAGEGELVTFTAAARDNDLGDVLTFSLGAGAPAGATIDPVTGVFSWTPSEAQGPGAYSITVRVTDSGSPAKSVARTFTVVVREVNVAPVLAPIGNKTLDEGTALVFTAAATDTDLPANRLTYSLIGAPAGATIDPTTGAFSWAPAEADGPGTFTFTVRATDDGSPSLFAEEQITVTVREVNTAPALEPLADRWLKEGETVTFTARARDADAPANGLTFSLGASAPAEAVIDPVTGVFRWAPAAAGTYPVTVRVTDNGSPVLSAERTVTITVSPVIQAPALGAIGNRSVDERTLLTFTASATDPNAVDTVTYSLLGAPNGAGIDARTGVFRWTPTEQQGPGSYTFVVRATDSGTPNLFDEEEVTVTVREVNRAPALAPIGDKVFTEGVARTFAVSATDPDSPSQVLTFSLIGAPDGVTIDPLTGAVSWTPSELQGGNEYAFTVRVTDDGAPALFAEQEIHLAVNELNSAPVLSSLPDLSAEPGTLVTFTAVATDPDLPANALRYSLVGAPAGASIDSVTGEFTWLPTQPGAYTFTVRVSDDGPVNLFDEAQVTVTVAGSNRPPRLDPLSDQRVDEGETLVFTAAASDPDAGQSLRFSLDPGAPAGAVIDPDTGAFRWTPTEADGPGTYSVTVRVTDNGNPAGSAFETITVTVAEVNQAPVLAPIGNKTVAEGTALTFVATAADPDLPANGLTFSLLGAPAGATIDPVTGAFSWAPTEAQGPATVTFTVRVTDSGAPARFDEEAITVTVAEVNQAPVLAPIENRTVVEGTELAFTASASDPDLPAQILTFSLVGAPAGASIDASTGVFRWTPTEVQGPASYTFDVVASDGTLTDSQTITVTVTEVNQNPVLDPVVDQIIDEESTLTFTATAHDSDLPANRLTFSATGLPGGATVDPTAGVFTWTPTELQDGTYSFDLHVSDGTATATRTVRVTVREVNAAPVLTGPGDRAVDELAPLAFALSATDADRVAGAPNALRYSIESGAQPGMTLDGGTGAFSWAPTESQNGTYVVTFRVTDDGAPARSDTKTIGIAVREVNRSPVLAPIADRTVREGDTLTFTVAATDPDLPANGLTFSLGAGAPAGASIDPVTGLFTWSPADGPGTGTVTVRVTDNGAPALSGSRTFTVTVSNMAPTATISGPPRVAAGQSTPFTLTASDPSAADRAADFRFAIDWDGDGVVDETVTGPSGTLVSHTFTGTGVRHVTVTATDKDGGVSAAVAAPVDVVAVTAFEVQQGAAQRSFVRYVDVTLDSAAHATALLSAGRVRLVKRDLTGSNPAPVSAGLLSVSGAALRLDFGANGLGGNRSSNAGDGYYTVELDLDGDGWYETSRSFYRLLGDTNGDRKVDQADVDLISAAITNRLYVIDLDLNGDGVVNSTDKLLATRALGRQLSAALWLDD